jgi:predicted nucleic acid-binding Zn ribbon protein
MSRRPRGTSQWEEAGNEDLRLTPLRDAMSSLLRSRGLESASVLTEVISAWEAAAGPEVAAKVTPVGLRGRELICEVADPAWATQMRLLSERLLSRLADELGVSVADQLTVRVSRRSGA